MLLTDNDAVDEARALREVIYDKLIKWDPELTSSFDSLASYASELVGHINLDLAFYKEPMANGVQNGVSSETLMKMRALAGPHGYAVWRALQINLAERIT